MTYALCVGAHPDDVEIGMGGTVAGLVAEGLDVVLVDLTDGEPTPYGTPELRAAEAATAARALGASRITLPFRNRELFDTAEARKALAEVIREHRPQVLFAPYPVDAHPDHAAASAICDAARFWAKFVKTDMRGEPHYPPRMYRYLAVHLRLHVKPSFVVDVSAVRPAKEAALRAYASQFSANPANGGVLDSIERLGAYWGALIGADAGEPFFSSEEVGVSSVTALR